MAAESIVSIIEYYLDSNVYGGLCTEGCGCIIGDLAPCDDSVPKGCVPGYRHDHTIGAWIIASDKDPKTDEEIEAIIKQADL